MNDIKFRAWDKDYKYMNHKVMVGNVWDEENYHAHMIWVDRKDVDYECESGWMNFDENSNIEIMQYTGLKDKNGVEIYEGDIVENASKDLKFQVVYEAPSFNRKWIDDTSKRYREHLTEPLAWNTYMICEVIGNIYENRKLLGRDGE